MSRFQEFVLGKRLRVLRSGNNVQAGYPKDSILALKSCLSEAVKHTPVEFTYDDRGSQLFDLFVDSAPYYLPKCEIEILQCYAEQIAELCGPVEVFEVGSGSGKKTAILLQAFQAVHGSCAYFPMDVNESIMVSGARKIQEELPNVEITCIAGTYSDIFSSALPKSGKRLLTFLGSSISQEKDDSLLRKIRETLDPGEHFLIAYDLLKPSSILCSAYDHPAAAALSENAVRNLNANFGADFDLKHFSYFARFNEGLFACETGQVSKLAQEVRVDAIGLVLEFEEGEVLRTGLQRKFHPGGFRKRLENVGFSQVATFSDERNWYRIDLFQAL
ncbi:MAG: L-histidine N(alpha)-methyltransferase [Boseongicola sp.]|nr:L-histidine N(alpha)-methyltransferase [Boseongicola sp.]